MTIYPNNGALTLAAAVHASIAGSNLKLFKAIASPLNVNTVIADFTVCDFSGYETKVILVFLDPYLDPAGGASFRTGTQQWNFDGADLTPVENSVYGWFLESGGDLVAAGTFDAPVSMAKAGDSLPLDVVLNMFRS